MKPLAIVIPAYKKKYFKKALDSLAVQTNKNFKVYIGDDCSPDNLNAEIAAFADSLDISYTRFTNNIGSKNLVAQWERCIRLTAGEEWLWLFSDDDIADPTCVACFFELIENANQQIDVCRFNTNIIDADDRTLYPMPVGPAHECSAEMAYNLLMGKRGNSMPDHIFSRDVFLRHNGLVHTQYAQGADWAMSMLYSKDTGMYIIPNARLNWRSSGVNISSTAAGRKNEMINGHLQFINWVTNHFKYLQNHPSPVSYEMIKHAAKMNLRNTLTNHYKGIGLRQIFKLTYFLHREFQLSYKVALKELIIIQEPNSFLLKKTIHVLKSFTNKHASL